jgi:steroid delta-isomerase-like uncharacterized protein
MVLSADPPSTDELGEVTRRNLQILDEVQPYWNSQDIPRLLSHTDENVLWRNVPMEQTYTGTAEFSEYVRELYKGFPDFSIDVTHRLAQGNHVAERWIIRGTHTGTFLGIPRTGKTVELPGMTMVEMRDGAVIRGELYYDSGVLMRQLGILPPLNMTFSPVGRSFLWMVVLGTGAGRAVARLFRTITRRVRSR